VPPAACQNPIVLDKFMWSLAALAWVRLEVAALTLLRQAVQTPAYNSRRPLALGFEALVTIPLMTSALIFRAASGENIAVDLPVTLLISIALALQMLTAGYGQYRLFAVLARGSAEMGTTREANALIAQTFAAYVLATTFFMAMLFGTQLAGVFIPTGPTPQRLAILVVRNMGNVAYFLFYLFLNRHQIASLKRLVAMASAQDDTPATLRYRATLEKFQDLNKASIRRIVLLGVVFTSFCAIPPLFCFNYVGAALVVAFAAGPNHYIHSFDSARAAANLPAKALRLAHESDSNASRKVAAEAGGSAVAASPVMSSGPTQ
jgi:hypothetical protein